VGLRREVGHNKNATFVRSSVFLKNIVLRYTTLTVKIGIKALCEENANSILISGCVPTVAVVMHAVHALP